MTTHQTTRTTTPPLTQPVVTLDIISDPICPWCYIGKARLDRALEQRPGFSFDIRWHPFQLNPDMPVEGMDRSTYLAAKFGGPEGAARVYGQIAAAAEASGLKIRFDRIARTPNTLDAHRLIHWAGVEGQQSLVVNQLFRRYFVEGEDISDPAVLCEVARSVGMDPDVVARLLASDADRDDTAAADARARDMGVTGVPTFIVGGQYAVPGAQDADLWLRVIDELIAAPTEAG